MRELSLRGGILTLVILLLVVVLGCGAKFWPPMIAIGNSSVGENCDRGDLNLCEDIVRGGEMGGGLVQIIEKLINTAVRVAGKFVPGGFGSQDTAPSAPTPAYQAVPLHTHLSGEIIVEELGVTLEHVKLAVQGDDNPSAAN